MSASDNESETQTLPRVEVIQRLRERGEPVMMFGESELEAFRRLRRCEILEPEVNRVRVLFYKLIRCCFMITCCQGFRNDFQEAMEKVDQDYLDELLAFDDKADEIKDELKDSSDISYEGIKELSKSLGRGNRELDMKVVMSFLQVSFNICTKKNALRDQ